MNNLLNITPKDPLYFTAARDILRRVVVNLGDEELAVLAALPEAGLVAGDAFFLHYTIAPIIKDKNENPVMEAVRQAMAEYAASEDYRRVHTLTRLDYELSLVYAIHFTEALSKALASKLSEEERQRLPSPPSPEALVQMLLDAASQAASEGGSSPAGGGQNAGQDGPTSQENGSADSSRDGSAGQAESGQNAGQDGLGERLAEAVKEAVKEAMRKAGEAVDMARDLRHLLRHGGGRGGTDAGDQPGQHDIIDLTQQIMNVDMAKEVISLARKLTEEAPKFHKIIKARAKHGETAGYRLTHKVEDALPRELALDDDLFFAKLASSGLLARERVTSAIGAMYVLLDISGSMDEGRKTAWSRSVALALYNVAKKRGQRFYLRMFDARVYDLTEDPTELILTWRSGGGTCINCALRTAVADIAERGLAQYTNTVILITDGEDQVDEGLVEELKRHGITLIAVMVQGHNETLKLLAERSDGQYLEVKPTRGGALKIVEAV